MTCFTIDSWTNQNREVTAHATASPNQNEIVVTIYAPYIKTTRIKLHIQGGMNWNPSWDLADLIETIEEKPEYCTTFDLSEFNCAKIPCIKAIRAVTGYGLKEAKEFVEAMVVLKAKINICDFQSHPT